MDLIPFAGYDVTRKVDAVFENGLLRPLHPIEGIDEHARVHLTIEGVEPSLEEVTPTNDVLLSLAKSHPPPPSPGGRNPTIRSSRKKAVPIDEVGPSTYWAVVPDPQGNRKRRPLVIITKTAEIVFTEPISAVAVTPPCHQRHQRTMYCCRGIRKGILLGQDLVR